LRTLAIAAIAAIRGSIPVFQIDPQNRYSTGELQELNS